MGARIFWAGNTTVHAATCVCILCRAERVKPELPMARLVPPWWVRVWAIWTIIGFLGCRAQQPEPLYNRAEAVPEAAIKPSPTATYWKDGCAVLNSRPFCVHHVSRYVGYIRCACCPVPYSMSMCMIGF